PQRRVREHAAHRPELVAVRPGPLDAGPGPPPRRALATHQRRRRLHARLRARPTGPVRPWRGRRARAGADRPPCPRVGLGRRRRREPRLARALDRAGRSRGARHFSAPPPSTGVRAVSHPDPSTSVAPSVYEPRRPTLIATGVFTLWIAILSLPMLRGQWLAGPFSDQVTAGLPFRGWGAEWWRRLGHVPLWNPEIFGGMPYVGALGTGDILYPTAFLRLVLPTATVMGIGLSILSQHVQMTYYMLVAAGLFALYLCFGTGTATTSDRIRVLGLASVAIALGFGIAAIQLLPAFEHMPLSARAVSVQGGFAGSTTYGIPWVHIPEFFLKNFVGWGHPGTYWGPNGLKLHSEYLGLPVIALALLGAGAGKDARLRLWLAGIGLLFLLIGLGKGTPFYHLWWSVMPYVKQMRAPGMAYFVVVFVVACFAAFGVERLEGRADGATCKSHVRAWLIAAGVLALLAVAGVFGNMAGALAHG